MAVYYDFKDILPELQSDVINYGLEIWIKSLISIPSFEIAKNICGTSMFRLQIYIIPYKNNGENK